MLQRRRFACILTLALAGCGTIATPQMNNTTLSRSLSTSAVSQQRLEETLALLTGVNPLDGVLLTDRQSKDNKVRTRNYLKNQLEAMGYQVEVQSYRPDAANVVATLPGESKEAVLVGGHFDTVRTVGADDNGSGTVAVLEAARNLKTLSNRKRTLIVAFFDEEERGLVGSTALARELKTRGIALHSAHTLDMVGWDSDGDRCMEIEKPDGNLWNLYQAANKNHGLNYPLVRTNSGSTDHDALRDAGFPSVGVCEEWTGRDTTPHYHRATDTYATVNFDYLTAVTKLVTAAVSDALQDVKVPQTRFVPHTQFPGREHI